MTALLPFRPARLGLPAAILLLATLLCTAAHAQKPAPLVDPEEKEQVEKPIPFTDQELKVIRAINSLPTERLVELMRVYDKLDNDAMTNILVRQVLKRNPQHAEALRISMTLEPDETVRPVGYLEGLAAQLMAGKKVDDPDAIAVQANVLTLENRANEAVELLEKLRQVNFGSEPFPYMQDLAHAYQDAGMYTEAEAAFQAVINDPKSLPEARQETMRAMPLLATLKRIAEMRKQAMQDPDVGLSLSAHLLTELPDDKLAVAFRIECLDRAGRYQEAIDYLLNLKSAAQGPVFEFQESLAYAYYGAKRWSEARNAFLEIIDTPGYDEEQRVGAEKMLTVLKMDQRIEKGVDALKKSDLTMAKVYLAQLEREYPKDRDVFAYRCLVMARTGQSDEALELLLRKRVEATEKGQLFMEADTLGDVYVLRKEFILAIDTYNDIINNPAYDARMRAEAVKGVEGAKQGQKMYQAYRALEDGKPSDAKELSEALATASPQDPEVRILGADIHLAYGRVEVALQEYEAIKQQYYPDMPFPGQSGIAESQFRLGNWESALSGYNEIIDTPGYEPNDVWSARWDRRSLLPYLSHHLSIDSHFISESEGSVFSQGVNYTTPWWNNWRFTVSAREDFIRLDDATRFTRDGNVNRFEGQVSVQRRLPGAYFAEASVGGTQDNVLYGARFGKFGSTGVGWGSIGWNIGFSGNTYADYSLPLRAINGRENRIDFNAAGYVHPRVRFDVNTYATWVNVDGDKLGDGYGMSGRVQYIVLPELRKRPEIAVGYFGEYTRFNAGSQLPDSVRRELRGEELQVRRALAAQEDVRKALPANHGREIFDSLVEPETSRHGVMVSIRKRLDLDWNVYGEAGAYRDFIGESWEYTFATGVEYWMTDRTMIYGELRYDSNGVASDQGVWQASLGAELTF